MGLKRLIKMGALLQIPEACLAAINENIKSNRNEVIEVLKASVQVLEYAAEQRENSTAIIGKWLAQTPM